MAAEKPAVKDSAVAHLLAAGSTLGAYLSPVRGLVNRIPSPNQVDARWYAMHGRADSISDWVEFPGLEASGRIPRNYKEAAIIKVDREKLDALGNEVGGVHAVAYQLGTAAMVGVMESRSVFGSDPEDDRFYYLSMGNGPGVLRAAAGRWLLEQHRLVVAEDSLVDGGRSPVDQLPSYIPLL